MFIVRRIVCRVVGGLSVGWLVGPVSGSLAGGLLCVCCWGIIG